MTMTQMRDMNMHSRCNYPEARRCVAKILYSNNEVAALGY